MKRWLPLVLALLLPALSGCAFSAGEPFSSGLSSEAAAPSEAPRRVVSLYASYTAAWLAAGGSLVGVTDDAVTERRLPVGDARTVGTFTRPSLEQILALEPDLVLASADIAGQLALQEQFRALGVRAVYDTVDTFEQYRDMMEQFLSWTGRSDLHTSLVDAPQAQVEAARAKRPPPGTSGPAVLLLRTNSAGVSAKADGTVANEILRDLGAVNIARKNPALLQDLSLEIILREDPAYIFVVPQGISDAQAQELIDRLRAGDPAWAALSGQWIVLPKDLYHYKPNERWGESYAALAGILFP
ncbi:MAG: ABC transporter substrate-binding protein [Oscillospiraceae bacterium]|nr:ABC transporter substrate-binding protein [Oscillospiraceae bacterium]